MDTAMTFPGQGYAGALAGMPGVGAILSPKLHRALPFVLAYEGGYSDDPHDPGGKTMKGIIQRVYDGYRRSKGLPTQWVKYIRDAEVEEIYKLNYWDQVRGDQLPDGVDLVVMDFGVNSGPPRAIMEAQRVLGLRIDGMLGPATLDALQRVDAAWFIKAYVEARRRFLRALSTFWRFGKGWLSRCAAVEQAALGMVGHPVVVDLHPDEYHEVAGHPVALQFAPLDSADEQSEGQGRAYPEAPKPPMGTEVALGSSGGGSMAMAAPRVIANAGMSGRITLMSLTVAIVSEPMFWIGMAALWGAVGVFIWRRRHKP